MWSSVVALQYVEELSLFLCSSNWALMPPVVDTPQRLYLPTVPSNL